MDQNTPRKSGGKKYWWAGGIVCLLAVAGLLAGWIYVSGYRVWTDGRDIVSPVSTANVRQVLWSTPEPMAAEFNTPGDEYEICLSSDSNELYFVRGRPGQGADIFTSRRTHNKWSQPLRLDAVNSKYDELGPRLSADGRLLLFYSNRPGGIGGYDVWVALRTDGVWGKPVNLGPNVNSTHNEYGPSITADNRTLYFASNRKAAERMGKRIQWRATIRQGQLGDYDLFSTEVDFSEIPLPTTATSQPTTAPTAGLKIRAEQALELQGVNTPHNEGTPCVSPWGDFLYFASNRPGGQGGFDLYRARIADGRCLRLENLGAEVNTAGNETDPQLTKGGFMLYFSSDRDGGEEGTYDLYTSESHEVYASRVGRGLPTLGWSIWVLLASLALLIPLMLFLRAGGYKHLSMLQKCFVVALLLHLVLTLLLSLAQVSQEIFQYVVDKPAEVELDDSADKQLEEKVQIRHQLADLAPAAPSETEVARLDTEFQPVQEVKRLDMNVPEAQRKPVEYISEPDKPKDEPKITPEQVATPTPTVHMSELAIKLNPPEVKIRSDEAKPRTASTPTSAKQARQPSAIVKTTRPDATHLPTETTKTVSDTLAHVAEVSRPVGDAQRRDYTPAPKLTEMSIALAAPKRSGNPIKEAPSSSATTVNVAEPTGAERKRVAASAAKAGSARIKTPTVQADSDSLMAESGPSRAERPVGDAVARADIPTPKVVGVAMNLSGPKINPSKVKAAHEPTDTASADKPAGSSRAAASTPTSTAGSAKLAVPSSEPTGKSLAMTGSPAKIARPLGKVSPRAALPAPAVVAVVVSPSSPKIKAAAKQVEARPQTASTPPSANQARQRSAIVKTTRPDATRLPTETTKTVPDTLAHVADVARPVGDAQRRDYTPTPRLAEMSIAMAAPTRSSNPIKEAPSAGATTVNVVEPAGAERKQVAASAAKAGSARIKTPTVQADSDSLMAESGPARAERPVGDAVARADIPTPKVVDVAMNLSGPKIKPSKVKAAREPTGAASADKPAGSSRATASKPTSTAGSAKLAVPSSEPTGKSLAMTGSPAKIARPLGKVSPQAALPAPAIAAVAVSPSSPKIKAATKQTEASPASAAVASLKSVRTGPVRSTAPTSKADLARLSTPTARSSEHSLASAITVTHQVAKASEVSVSVNVPLPNNAPKLGLPTPPASVAVVRAEAAVGKVATEVTTAGIGKIAAADKPPAGLPQAIRAETRAHKPSIVSVVKNAAADRPGRTAYTPQADLARPLVAIGPMGGKLGPPESAKPEVLFHRKFEQRQRLLKDMGGTKASEAAVARALLYLSRTQEKDGAWGTITGNFRKHKHKRQDTDVALTGLSALCFLAGDHTPSKDGPYRDTVTKAVDFLIEQQRKDGSMWTRGGRMYGHAIATLALSEAAIMTNDPKYRNAAIKGARFIIKAQTRSHGGWRYEPRKDGDTSVVGWCVMALYSVKQMGMEIPPETFKGAIRWLDRVSCGRTKILCGYTGPSPKPAMSAEGAFSRILLGQKLSDAQQKELAAYLDANKKATAGNFYLAYYASLAMMQIGGEAWQRWNPQMRERLVALQTRGGSNDGAWTTQTTYRRNAGIVYTTTMATLTLEVYYRYLPMLGASFDGASDPGGKPYAPKGPKPRSKKRR